MEQKRDKTGRALTDFSLKKEPDFAINRGWISIYNNIDILLYKPSAPRYFVK